MRLALRPKALLAASAVLGAGCAPIPPAHWQDGGASLDIPSARWVRGDATIEIAPDGKVTMDREHVLTIDRVGRVVDIEATPVALLEPDGRLVGPDDRSLGFVGTSSAAPPWNATAWVSVLPSGEVVRYDQDGERRPFGVWSGQCGRSPSARQVCTLVTHVLALRTHRTTWGGTTGVSFGIGIGIIR